MRKFLRVVLGIKPAVTSTEAVEAAKRECERQDVPFREPVKCSERLRHYVVVSPANRAGACVFVGVSIETGKIISFQHFAR